MKTKYNISIQHSVRGLWRAVIMQAVVDASSKSKNRRAISHKKKAREWLKLPQDETFINTCMLAEMEPSYVKMKIDKIFK